jgi:hypothetical protein
MQQHTHLFADQSTAWPFTEDLVFDFVNDFPHSPDDAPCFKRLFCLKQTTKRILTLEMFSYTIPPERRSGLKFCPSSSTERI